jgi:hypothetical protein
MSCTIISWHQRRRRRSSRRKWNTTFIGLPEPRMMLSADVDLPSEHQRSCAAQCTRRSRSTGP